MNATASYGFTILDFKKATNCSHDERFDGNPGKSDGHHAARYRRPESDFEEQFDEHEEETEDDITGVDEDPAPYTVTDSGDVGPLPEEDENKVRKFHVNGVAVGVIAQRVQYYDLMASWSPNPSKITPAKRCSKSNASRMISPQMAGRRAQTGHHQGAGAAGDYLEVLAEEVGKELDPFDMAVPRGVWSAAVNPQRAGGERAQAQLLHQILRRRAGGAEYVAG